MKVEIERGPMHDFLPLFGHLGDPPSDRASYVIDHDAAAGRIKNHFKQNASMLIIWKSSQIPKIAVDKNAIILFQIRSFPKWERTKR